MKMTCITGLKRLISTQINQIKRGNHIEFKNKVWQIVNTSHHTQGRGGGHYKLELRDMQGTKIVERFNSGTSVELVNLDQKKYQFLYIDTEINVLDTEMNQHAFPLNLMHDADKKAGFLTDEMAIYVDFHKGQPVCVRTADKTAQVVTETRSPISSETAKGTVFKRAQLENGQEVDVPEFIKTGDTVWIDMNTLKYLSRK